MKKEVKFLDYNSSKGIFARVNQFIFWSLPLVLILKVVTITSPALKAIFILFYVATGVSQFVTISPFRPHVNWNRKRIEFTIESIWKKPTVFKFSNITSFEIKNESLILEENYGDITTFDVADIDYDSREKILKILRENIRN